MSRCEDYPCCGHEDGGCGGSSYPRRSNYSGLGRDARRTPPAEGTRRENKYAGDCAYCGGTVAAGSGVITAKGGKWLVSHRPTELSSHAFPRAVYVGGCPGQADAMNARGVDVEVTA